METLTQQLDQLRSHLLREREEIVKRMERNQKFGMNENMRDEIGELSLIDNHPADIGSEVFERGKDLALTDLTEQHLRNTEAALARMDEGTYGTCMACGQTIPFERLQAVPSAQYCVRHVPKGDRNDRFQRPAEEQILRPAMHSDTDGDDSNAFDGEDAWQIVERWGTSNTPALQEGNELTDYNNMYIESDENEGYVEPLESFLATDMYGNNVTFIRNDEYQKYWERGEGYGLLEPDDEYDDPV